MLWLSLFGVRWLRVAPSLWWLCVDRLVLVCVWWFSSATGDREGATVNIIDYRQQALGIAKSDRGPGWTSIYFDAVSEAQGTQGDALAAGVESWLVETTEGSVWRLDVEVPWLEVRRELDRAGVVASRLSVWRRALRGELAA